ncbi:ABC transporter ATPase [Pseudosulfitobacter pseudonitzschiae]|uniref:ABC transporter ATPase n=1 Tax=Pseudosulfitobacter pseudonitzschiae TaxID=1402135 RepID=A0A073IW65_9RHOB|nr:ABC transporter ATP-binding protein [Pseudosulfitobacter pseudonitzschiae]KEJ93865.1 ABC transporter ATPase [Pseudosulfitobacter pseudonitzschiae]
MMQAPAIQLSGSYHIDGTCLFAPIDMTLPAGEWTCVLGRSGVGKSTILRLIAGVRCAGDFQGAITASDRRPLEGRVSVMAQSDLLLPWLSVLENTVLGARLRGEVPDLRRAANLLERVGLARHADKRPDSLSGGMRQRAALARTLMEDRPVVLLDEPFSALDAGTRADMQDLAAGLLKDRTVLLVTHDPAEAVRLGHQIIVLTADAAQPWTPPSLPPIRDQYAPDTVACQAQLLAHLRRAR